MAVPHISVGVAVRRLLHHQPGDAARACAAAAAASGVCALFVTAAWRDLGAAPAIVAIVAALAVAALVFWSARRPMSALRRSRYWEIGSLVEIGATADIGMAFTRREYWRVQAIVALCMATGSALLAPLAVGPGWIGAVVAVGATILAASLLDLVALRAP